MPLSDELELLKMREKALPKRRSPRLKEYDYSTPSFYLVTICAKDRKKLFTDKEINMSIIELLKSEREKQGLNIIAFCIMPEHIHLLIEIPEGGTNLSNFIRVYKSRVATFFRNHRYERDIWQARFYDRILRKSESVIDVAAYILNNPVRKGIVENWQHYKFCGLIDEISGT